MRLQSRPGFIVHRAFHRTLIRFQVWRNNRSVAEAFRDAEACDVIYRHRGTAQTRILKSFLGAGLVIAIAAVWNHHRTGTWALRTGSVGPDPAMAEPLPATLGSRHMAVAGGSAARPAPPTHEAFGFQV
jgi:hypothetical protein